MDQTRDQEGCSADLRHWSVPEGSIFWSNFWFDLSEIRCFGSLTRGERTNSNAATGLIDLADSVDLAGLIDSVNLVRSVDASRSTDSTRSNLPVCSEIADH